MIFVVCSYQSQCKYWFDQLVSRHQALTADENNLIVKLMGCDISVQFVAAGKELKYGDEAVIFWNVEGTIEELEYEISRTIRLLI